MGWFDGKDHEGLATLTSTAAYNCFEVMLWSLIGLECLSVVTINAGESVDSDQLC
jgi:hypothetical protein